MSRNLGRVDCRECPGGHEHIVMEEAPRPVEARDVGDHNVASYAGLIVARARCILCHALYLAWVDWPISPSGYFRLACRDSGLRFVDLSFRHAFDDDPSAEDAPLFEVERVVSYRRRPIAAGAHRAHPFGDLDAWRARQGDVVDSGLSVLDEIAIAKPGR